VDVARAIDHETGMGQEEAYMLLTMAGKARLGNMVDPKYTIGTGIAKKYIGL
jgi:acetamidase/formamidase